LGNFEIVYIFDFSVIDVNDQLSGTQCLRWIHILTMKAASVQKCILYRYNTISDKKVRVDKLKFLCRFWSMYLQLNNCFNISIPGVDTALPRNFPAATISYDISNLTESCCDDLFKIFVKKKLCLRHLRPAVLWCNYSKYYVYW